MEHSTSYTDTLVFLGLLVVFFYALYVFVSSLKEELAARKEPKYDPAAAAQDAQDGFMACVRAEYQIQLAALRARYNVGQLTLPELREQVADIVKRAALSGIHFDIPE